MIGGFRRYLIAALALALAVASASSSARVSASQGQLSPPQAAADAAPPISAEALAQIDALIREKDFRSDAQQKIDSQLLFEMRMESGLSIAARVDALETDLPYAGDGHIVVDVKARLTNRLRTGLAALGIEVLSSSAAAGTLRLHVDIDQVEAIAALPDVDFVQPKQEAQVHQAAPNVSFAQTGQGSKSSEGDVTHLAYAARAAFGATGKGVKIGILSDGVTSLKISQDSGDLGPVTVLSGQAGSGDEGTAMLEIVHDLAPDAQLFFATAFKGITSFADNIRALRAAGCDIIIDDVAYFVETPFQDGQAPGVISNTNGGVVIQAVNDVIADGALYFSAAGNSGHVTAGTSGTWEGDFVDGGPTGVLPSGLSSGRLHSFGGQNYNVIKAPAPGINPTNLFWSDPLGGSANDYDLFRLNSTGTLVNAASTNIQSGTQDPFEQLGSAGSAGDRIVIVQKNGAANRFLHLGTNRGMLTLATEGEIHGHPAAAGAYAVAATPAVGPFPLPFSASNVLETFSSDGPRRVFFRADGTPYTDALSAAGGVLRQKPDVTAADGVSITGAGGFPTRFFGTSAAAPHAGAIAALLMSADRTLNPAQIRALLTSTAIDIGPSGADNDSGAGIVMADAVIRAAGVPGTPLVEMTTVLAAENPGNGNGALEAGEGGRLTIPLANYGGAPATSVSATLTSSTPGIVITQPATRLYPALAIGTSANAAPYLFTIASDFPCPQAASFTLTVTSDSASPRAFTFDVPMGPPPVSITTTLGASARPELPALTTTGLQTSRLTRNGVASACGAPKSAPALLGTSVLQFDAFAFNTCPNSAPTCVTVTLEGANAGSLFSAAYSPAFSPTNVQQNYLADAGASAASRSYSFNLPGGPQTFVLDVHEIDPGVGAGGEYTLTIAGACVASCSPNHVPVAAAKDVTVLADASGTASASIDDRSSDPDGDRLTITQSPAGPYTIGRTTVLLTVTDPKGATSQATATVTVVSPTTTVVSAAPTAPVAGQAVTFTATVTANGGGIATDGAVTFQDGPIALAAPLAVSNGQASVTIPSLSDGTHTITAFYSSTSGLFVASHGSVTVTTAGATTVPDVVGFTQTAAAAAIVDAGLVVGTVTTASSATVPGGSVVSSTPAAGERVARGTAVDLVLSTGPAHVEVPDVVGQTQTAAAAAITGAGLIVGTVTKASSTTVPYGVVISESPAAGTSVVVGSAVDLVVSSGPAHVVVPDVVGQTQTAAAAAITGAGLIVGTVTKASSATVVYGAVISESPAAGTSVVVGSAVDLVVSSGPPRVAVPDVVGQTQAAATAAITGAGLIVGTVTKASSATVAVRRGDQRIAGSRDIGCGRQRRRSRRVERTAARRGSGRRRSDAGRCHGGDYGRGVCRRHDYDDVERDGAERVRSSASRRRPVRRQPQAARSIWLCRPGRCTLRCRTS